jgi:chromosome segregation ATPase
VRLADKTFGFKVSDELYEKVKMMIENSGSSSKEWFERAVALAEVQDLKEGSPDYKQDLSELEVHTTRIYELVANMIQRAHYIKEDALRELAEKLNSRELMISSLQADVKALQDRLSQLDAEAKQVISEKNELNKQLEEQHGVNVNNQALIQEYKDKIDTLSSLVNQYKDYATENTALKEEIANLKERFTAEKDTLLAEFEQKESHLKSSIEELKSTVRDQEDQIEKLTRENEEQKVNHVNELNRLTEAKDLAKERATLEIERKYQEKLQEIHEQYNEKIARLYEKFELKARNNAPQPQRQNNKK